MFNTRITQMLGISCPIIQGGMQWVGGIGDGRGMAAALATGAEGVNMGTRFVCTQEAPVHQSLKNALRDASERDTQLIFRTMNNTARVFKNAVSNQVIEMERRPGGCRFDDIATECRAHLRRAIPWVGA
jgi:NAD(P)H-dependent flavin oxidoreductase YrpB (nitropropane dioxygenase family)